MDLRQESELDPLCNWVTVEKLTLSCHDEETTLLTIYTHYGNSIKALHSNPGML